MTDATTSASSKRLETARPCDEAQGTRAYQRYAVALLLLVAFFYQLDRHILYVTQELIKNEFRLSDTQVGLVSGLAYGLANGLAGIPMGWLIDRVRRTRFLAICVMIWSGLTALCGLAGSFVTLFIVRAGVGAVEAAGTPASLSIVSDIFPPKSRASKMGLISTGYMMGVIGATLAGGYIAASYGWRAAFVIYGVPGVLFGVLMFFTFREPERTGEGAADPVAIRQLPLAIALLCSEPALRLIFIATAMTSLVSTGTMAWWASFMLRVHEIDLPTVGVITMFAQGLVGMIGMVLVGYATDWARRRSVGGPLLIICATTASTLAFQSIAIWTPSTVLMVAALCIGSVTSGAYLVPRNLAISELAPANLRGLAFTLPVIIANLVGSAFGPVVVGMISDASAAYDVGIEPLRIAMFTVLALNAPVILLYYLASKHMVKREM